MKKKLKKPSIKTVNHKDGGMSFYAEGGEFDFVRNQSPNVPTNFEQRMYHTPHIDNEDGSMSSHKMMSWSDENGEHSAPTIVYQNGQLVELTPDEAIEYAYKTGEMKTFNNFQDSLDYGNNGYKYGTPMEMFAPNPEFEPNALYGGRNEYAKGGELPKYGKAGTVNSKSWPKPTASDSLALYNNSLKVLDYYNNKMKNGYQKGIVENRKVPISEIEGYYNTFLNNNKIGIVVPQQVVPNSRSAYKKVTTTVPEKVYRSPLNNPYQFLQREKSSRLLNTMAPISMYDRRIEPTSIHHFFNLHKFSGDAAEVPVYDPLAIKPYAMLTPAERKLREQRYGDPIPSGKSKTKGKTIKSKGDSKIKISNKETGPKVFTEIPSPLNPNYKPEENFMFKSYADMVNGTLPKENVVQLDPVEITAKRKPINVDDSGDTPYNIFIGNAAYKTYSPSKAKKFAELLGAKWDNENNAYTYDKVSGKGTTWIMGYNGKLYPSQKAYDSGEYKTPIDPALYGMGHFQKGGPVLPRYATQGQVVPNSQFVGPVRPSYSPQLYPAPSLDFQNRVQQVIANPVQKKYVAPVNKNVIAKDNARTNAVEQAMMERASYSPEEVEYFTQNKIPTDKWYATKTKAQNDAIIKQRQDYKNEAVKQYEENPFGDFTTAKSENLKNEFRAFPNDANSFFDDYINPFVHLGRMAGNITNLMVPNNDPNAPIIDIDIPAWLQALGEPVLTGMGASFGANNTSQFVNNLVNPVAGMGLKRSLANHAPDGLQYTKDWYNHPDFIRRYAPTGKHDPASMQTWISESLDKYQDKNYIDLLKDQGIKDYLTYFNTTGGLSYGVPESIYLNRPMYWGDKLGLESVRGHELSHLTNKNGRMYSAKDEDALLKPFGYDNASQYDVSFGQGLNKRKLKDKKYYLFPSEIQARMQQARMRYNLTPDDKFTQEMYDDIMSLPKQTKGHNFFGMGNYIKDKPEFINLMNNFWGASPLAVPTGIGLGAALYNSRNPSLPQNQFGGGIELSNRMFEEGGEYELTNEEIQDLKSQGYDIELL